MRWRWAPVESQHPQPALGQTVQLRRYRLTRNDLSALAAGNVSPRLAARLLSAELSKHELLFELVRRTASRRGSSADVARVKAATKMLEQIQTRKPKIIETIFTLPQFGAWAADCLLDRTSAAVSREEQGDSSAPFGFGYITAFAAVAALMARHPFELDVPMRSGIVTFPSLGQLHTEDADISGWVKVQFSGDQAMVISRSRTTAFPMAATSPSSSPDSRWVPVSRVNLAARGVTLSLALDAQDPFFDRFGLPLARLSEEDVLAWRKQLADAWKILVRTHRPKAKALAATLTSIVPLDHPSGECPISASSGWASGAIALSLQLDSLSLAETLTHEFHHLVLGAVEDIMPLYSYVDADLYYAPWRDDPRPFRELLQGAYAHLGVVAFWERQREIAKASDYGAAEIEFAYWRKVTLQAVETLNASDALTEAGLVFVSTMRARLASWRIEHVSDHAEAEAEEIIIEHYLRWRLTHLYPDPAAIEKLVRRWSAGLAAPDWFVTPAAVVKPDSLLSTARYGALKARHRDPALFRRYLQVRGKLPEADIAFLKGDYSKAVQGYLSRIRESHDLDAWVGLICVRYREAESDTMKALLKRAEVVASLHYRIREYGNSIPSPDELIEWLAASTE
jgi:HEXXH motif-containing protein